MNLGSFSGLFVLLSLTTATVFCNISHFSVNFRDSQDRPAKKELREPWEHL